MTRRQCNELYAAREEQGIGVNQKCVCRVLCKPREDGINIAVGGGSENFDLPPDDNSSGLGFFGHKLSTRIA